MIKLIRGIYAFLNILCMRYVTMQIQNGAMGAATASDGGRAPMVRIMTSCINIKRGVWALNVMLKFVN